MEFCLFSFELDNLRCVPPSSGDGASPSGMMLWGNDVRFVQKKPKTLLDQFIVAAYGDRPPKARRADLGMAVDLAHSALLMGAVEKSEIAEIARGLFDGEIPYSTHDLALATSLNFFKRPELRADLEEAQLMARLTSLGWFQEGKVVPLLLKSFEDTLYKVFK